MLKQKLDWSWRILMTHWYKVHFIKWITLRAEAHVYRMFSLWWLQCPVNAFPTKYWVSFPVLLPICHFFFAPWPLVISYIPCHIMFLFLCHCLTLLSPLHLSLMLNVIPPFFRLWFRWHLPCVAVIAKCRLGRWDIGQPSPLLSHPFLTPSLFSGMAIPQFVLNACRVR